MEKAKKFFDKVLEWSCIGILAFMTLLVTYQVVTRYFFNSPSAISEVLARYLFVWMVLLGSAYMFGKREHMNIPVLKDRLPFKGTLICEMISEVIILLFSTTVILIGGLSGAMRQMGQLDSALQISMGVIYLVLPLSGICMIFYFLYNMKTLLAQWKAGTKEEN